MDLYKERKPSETSSSEIVQCEGRTLSNFLMKEVKLEISDGGVTGDLYTEEKYEENRSGISLPICAVLSLRKIELGISRVLVLYETHFQNFFGFIFISFSERQINSEYSDLELDLYCAYNLEKIS